MSKGSNSIPVTLTSFSARSKNTGCKFTTKENIERLTISDIIYWNGPKSNKINLGEDFAFVDRTGDIVKVHKILSIVEWDSLAKWIKNDYSMWNDRNWLILQCEPFKTMKWNEFCEYYNVSPAYIPQKTMRICKKLS